MIISRGFSVQLWILLFESFLWITIAFTAINSILILFSTIVNWPLRHFHGRRGWCFTQREIKRPNATSNCWSTRINEVKPIASSHRLEFQASLSPLEATTCFVFSLPDPHMSYTASALAIVGSGKLNLVLPFYFIFLRSAQEVKPVSLTFPNPRTLRSPTSQTHRVAGNN